MYSTPLNQVAAANPVISPTIPPPSAIIKEFLSKPNSKAASYISFKVLRFLCFSPALIKNIFALKLLSFRLFKKFFPYKLDISSLEITSIFLFLFTPSLKSSLLILFSIPASNVTSYDFFPKGTNILLFSTKISFFNLKDI